MRTILALLLSCLCAAAQTVNVSGKVNAGTVTLYNTPDPSVIWVSTNWLSFGTNLTGVTNDLSVTVSNAGTGTLSGTATTVSPFSVVTPSSYAISGTQVTNVVVRYTRSGEQNDTNELTLTGGGGTQVHLSGRSTNASASCPSSASQEQTAGTTASYVGLSDATYYVGQRAWSDASARTICRVDFQLTKAGTDISGFTYTAKIWSLTGNNLNATLATSTGVLGTNAWSNTWVPFWFSTPYATTGSTEYAITVDRAGTDGSSAVESYRNTEGTLPGSWDTWNAAKTQQEGGTDEMNMKIYWQ